MESPIMTLFRQWEACYQAAVRAKTDEEGDPLITELGRLAKEILPLPVTSTADLAAKLLSFTSYGDFTFDDAGGSTIIDEAKRLTQPHFMDCKKEAA